MAIPITDNAGRIIYIDEGTGRLINQDVPPDEADLRDREKDKAQADLRRFDPTRDRITNTETVPGGTQVTYVGPQGSGVAFIPSTSAGEKLSPNTVLSSGVTRQNALDQITQSQRGLEAQAAQQKASLGEQQRQYNETFGFEKAKFNTTFPEQQRQFDANLGENQRQFNLGQDLDRGKTLLGLGSRPDTLIRYLYALRGQQAPQGAAATALPGFGQQAATTQAPTATSAPQVAQQIAPQTAPAVAPAPPAITPEQRVAQVKSMIAAPPQAGDLAQFTQGATSTNVNPNPLMRAGVTAANPIEARTVSAQNELLKQGRVPRAYVGNVAIFGQGGIIPEPVIGVGLRSGQTYAFGENEPEGVVPADQLPPSLKDQAGEVVPAPTLGARMYARGGLIGYEPDYSPTLAPPSLFNPAEGIRPTAMDFPQIPHFTGGTSYIPSAQRLSQSTGTERDLYAGYLNDELGIPAQDVFELARKLAPQVSGLRTPRFAE